MPAYTVERVDQAKPFKTKDGHDLVSYTVLLKGEDGIGDIAQRNMKPDSKAPATGDTWDCTLEPNGTFPKKVKMAQKPFGGGGYKGKSPEEQKAIVRQHSQEMALRYLTAKGVTDFKLNDDFRKIIDWFQNDAGGQG